VGAAIGALGTDLAMDAADVVLMGSDLRRIPQLLHHAESTRQILFQGMVLSTAVIVGLVPLALTGAIGMTPLVMVHEISGVLIILNGLRAGHLRELRPLGKADSPSSPGECHGDTDHANAATRGRLPVRARRAAVILAVVAAVVGLGGGLLHTTFNNRSKRYPNYTKSAAPVLPALEKVLDDATTLEKSDGDDPVYTIDCAGARKAVDRLSREMPDAPDDTVERYVDRIFAQSRDQYDACEEGDDESMNAAAKRVEATRASLRGYLVKKSGGHNH
jgi:hypothetical protein